MRVIDYVIPLGEGARKRHYHESVKGEVIGFVVQMEIYLEGNWREVIRYDTVHGFPHIDRYYLNGTKKKIKVNLRLNEALILADEDIKENWKSYQRDYLEGK